MEVRTRHSSEQSTMTTRRTLPLRDLRELIWLESEIYPGGNLLWPGCCGRSLRAVHVASRYHVRDGRAGLGLRDVLTCSGA